MLRLRSHMAIAILVLPILSACTAAPRTRPVKAGDVDTGATSVEAVRRQLMGSWELTSLVIYSPTGEKTPAQASGTMRYDEFGNMSMRGTVTGTSTLDPSLLNLTGRVAIDATAKTLKFTAVDAATADDRRVDPTLDAKNTRYYEFTGDLLLTTVKASDGKTTATAMWKRIQ
jgi:hypothetical protein